MVMRVNETKKMLEEAQTRLLNGELDHKDLQALNNSVGKLNALAGLQLKMAEMRNELPRVSFLIEDEAGWDTVAKKYFGPKTKK